MDSLRAGEGAEVCPGFAAAARVGRCLVVVSRALQGEIEAVKYAEQHGQALLVPAEESR